MPIKTYEQQLEEVQAAISALLGNAQEYRIGDRMLRRADLEWLHEREKFLMQQYQKTQSRPGGGIQSRRAVPLYD